LNTTTVSDPELNSLLPGIDLDTIDQIQIESGCEPGSSEKAVDIV
jgi:hypothetical protein